jgi:hypothetical protein
MIRRVGLFAALTGAILFWTALYADAGTYVEDFTTTTYNDPTQTTAWWDTALGELKLYPFNPGLVGSYDTPGQSLGIYVTGNFVYAADGGSGLQIISIANPAAPVLLGSYNTPGTARDVDVAGDLAYLADGSSGLQIINVSNSATPNFLTGYSSGDHTWDVCVSGDRVFMADGTNGLLVVSAYNPLFPPALIGQYDTPGTAYGVCVRGDWAFVADEASGLHVIDVSDPSSPTLVGTYDTPYWAMEVFVDGNYAFVADHGSGLQVIDVSDPSSPTLVGTYDTPGSAWDVRVSGNWAYVADYGSGVHVVDISNPASPVLSGTYDTSGLANGVCVDGEHAFVADYEAGTKVIDVTRLTSPIVVGSYNFSGEARGVIIEGDHAFVAGDVFGGLQIIDISDPTAPVLAGSYNTTGEALDVDVAGDHAYIASFNAGLHVLDVSNPSAPVLVGTYDTANNAMGVHVQGNYAHIADYGSGLRVIDITDPSSPTLAGFYDTPGLAYDLDVEGNYAYVADADYGVQVISISPPSTPTLAGNYDTAGGAIGVCVAGDYCYVADHDGGLVVLDISNPAAPSLHGSYNTSGFARDVTVAGDFAFVADWNAGLKIIDISDPSSPTLVESVGNLGNTRDVRVAGDHAFVAGGSSGLKIAQVFQSDYDEDRNTGWSHAVSPAGETILKTRVTTTQTGIVSWELRVDPGAGGNWETIQPNGNWNTLLTPGPDLMWRSTHQWSTGTNSAVSQLQIDWLIASAGMKSIVDVPNDQGGWVRANFTRSAYDFVDEPDQPIVNYGIWRRQNGPVPAAGLRGPVPAGVDEGTDDQAPLMSGLPMYSWRGRTFVDSREAQASAASFPPGTWEWVATVPALQQDDYVAVLPTAADSSASGTYYTVLVITAHTTTPSVWYASTPDSGYSVDNIAPSAPTGFAVAYNTGGGNQLTWDPCPDEDFHYFNVYRSIDPEFEPTEDVLVHSTTSTSWADPEYDGWGMAYKLTAVDDADNESVATGPDVVSGAGGGPMPQRYSLRQNVPNPFNPSTVVHYDVPPGGGAMSLQVFDVSGRLVRTLVEGIQTAGHKRIAWDGRDDSGQPVSSGLYFYRLQAGDYAQTRKMLLLK